MSGWKIHFEVRNIGDDRGITSHLSEANFKFKIKGYTVLQGHEWIGNLFLGDRMSWRGWPLRQIRRVWNDLFERWGQHHIPSHNKNNFVRRYGNPIRFAFRTLL